MSSLRRRLLAVPVLLLAFPAAGTPVASLNDNDYDGIDDGLEQQLAEQFLPQIRYNWHEACDDVPSPRPILYRLRHGSANGVIEPDYIVINYVRLYDWDCGVPAWPGHRGDNEPFLVFLRRVNGNWTFSTMSAMNHGGTPYENPSYSFEPVLWVSKNKHANYAELSKCDGNGGVDYCSADGPTYAHTLYNVGEPNARLITILDAVYAGWWNDAVWNDSSFLDGGNIESQLYTSGFIHMTAPSARHQCLVTCQQQELQCNKQNQDFEYCAAQKSFCESGCYAEHPGWDQ